MILGPNVRTQAASELAHRGVKLLLSAGADTRATMPPNSTWPGYLPLHMATKAQMVMCEDQMEDLTERQASKQTKSGKGGKGGSGGVTTKPILTALWGLRDHAKESVAALLQADPQAAFVRSAAAGEGAVGKLPRELYGTNKNRQPLKVFYDEELARAQVGCHACTCAAMFSHQTVLLGCLMSIVGLWSKPTPCSVWKEPVVF